METDRDTRTAPFGSNRLLHTVIAVLVLALSAACGSSSQDTPTSSSTVDTSTPDGVATAFAAAYAAGDTPTACTYTAGLARQNLSQGGTDSLCARSGWPAQTYWLANQCSSPATDIAGDVHHDATYWYVYGANGPVGGSPGFLVNVTGADRAWQVTAYTSGPPSALGQVCAVLASPPPSGNR